MLTAGGFAAAGDLASGRPSPPPPPGASRGTSWATGPGAASAHAFLARLAQGPGPRQAAGQGRRADGPAGLPAPSSSRAGWSARLGPGSTWSPAAPRYGWARFTSAGVAGEAVWAGLYVGTGYGFAGNVEAASQMLGSVLGMIAGAGAVLVLGYWLFSSTRPGCQATDPLARCAPPQAALPSR